MGYTIKLDCSKFYATINNLLIKTIVIKLGFAFERNKKKIGFICKFV